MFRPDRPFNGLPPLPPASDIETRVVLKACIEARAALATLKTAGALIPDPTILIGSIPMLEAQASSEIENIVTTTEQMFRFASLSDDRADPATKEALRYRRALDEGIASLRDRPLSTATAVRLCSVIKGVDMDIRATPGTALKNAATGEIVYTPPEGAELLRGMLANWERFLHDAQHIDPLIRMAALHYQFEAIHPFTDGNGRTGRVLNLLFLVEAGLLDAPTLYLSRHIIRHKADYYRLLLAVTVGGAWEEWLLFMLDAVRETAIWTTEKVAAIRALLEETSERMRRDASKIYSRELAELIFAKPYCQIGDVVAAGVAKRQTASVYLKRLCEIGILAEQDHGREKLFVNGRLLSLLTGPDA